MSFITIVIIGLALLFSFLNGVHDSRNVVSTLISSRAYSPHSALGIAALAEFFGPFLFGAAVAQTIGRGIVDASIINHRVLLIALIGAIIWNLLTWFIRLPSSSSHALIGGLLGAATVQAGASAIQVSGLFRILLFLFVSPILGLAFGFVLYRIIFALSQNANPRINSFFKRAQIFTAIILGLSHGSNDGQKSMGIITLALVTGGYLSSFTIPPWVIVSCALALSLGTTLGGWRLIRTVGGIMFYKIRPMDGFTAQVTSALVILTASVLGGPVSATQVITTSVMGVGAAERANKVRWGLAQDIAVAWVLTIPATTLLAGGIYWLSLRFF